VRAPLTVPEGAYSITVFRDCPQHHGGIGYRAVLERTGEAAVRALLEAAHHERQICAHSPDWEHFVSCSAIAVLDVVNRDGDIITDYCIATASQFSWWERTAELRLDSADHPECER
jgi:hypothetical protein